MMPRIQVKLKRVIRLKLLFLLQQNQFELKKNELNDKYPRIDEIPFDSNRKLMTTINDYDGISYVHTKGAIDGLLVKCTHYETAEGPQAIG